MPVAIVDHRSDSVALFFRYWAARSNVRISRAVGDIEAVTVELTNIHLCGLSSSCRPVPGANRLRNSGAALPCRTRQPTSGTGSGVADCPRSPERVDSSGRGGPTAATTHQAAPARRSATIASSAGRAPRKRPPPQCPQVLASQTAPPFLSRRRIGPDRRVDSHPLGHAAQVGVYLSRSRPRAVRTSAPSERSADHAPPRPSRLEPVGSSYHGTSQSSNVGFSSVQGAGRPQHASPKPRRQQVAQDRGARVMAGRSEEAGDCHGDARHEDSSTLAQDGVNVPGAGVRPATEGADRAGATCRGPGTVPRVQIVGNPVNHLIAVLRNSSGVVCRILLFSASRQPSLMAALRPSPDLPPGGLDQRPLLHTARDAHAVPDQVGCIRARKMQRAGCSPPLPPQQVFTMRCTDRLPRGAPLTLACPAQVELPRRLRKARVRCHAAAPELQEAVVHVPHRMYSRVFAPRTAGLQAFRQL